jgi:hypothetical protein
MNLKLDNWFSQVRWLEVGQGREAEWKGEIKGMIEREELKEAGDDSVGSGSKGKKKVSKEWRKRKLRVEYWM